MTYSWVELINFRKLIIQIFFKSFSKQQVKDIFQQERRKLNCRDATLPKKNILHNKMFSKGNMSKNGALTLK